ncbi:hypothetical protein LCGC14_2200900 [marine sediment metagenome]|uniref:Right handed beta helix domain-containing protein n=1 Tax=marine sediment metagenome TaxID=412755 RepID=A0A0F9DH01_9ZZZZ
MKSSLQLKKVIVIIIALSAISIAPYGSTLNFIKESKSIGSSNSRLTSSTVSEKITISRNSGWADFKNAGKCVGDGTFFNPYIIKDLVIDALGIGSGIQIIDSDVFFIIKNVTITNSGPYYWQGGIELSGVKNGFLNENILHNNLAAGISLLFSNNNTVFNNLISPNY